jgi:predicted phage terminase large subunit-like protein
LITREPQTYEPPHPIVEQALERGQQARDMLAPPGLPIVAQLGDPGQLAKLVERERCLRSFAYFVRRAWPYIDPAPLVWGWHLDAMCLHLQAVTEGRIQRLVINIPPGHAKSMIVSVLWPAWVWARRPQWQVMTASYDETLSTRDAVKTRTLIETPWYRELLTTDPRTGKAWNLSGDQNVKSYYANSAFGFRLCVVVGSGTGKRGDALVIDDPQNALKALSDEQRQKVIVWKTETMSSRFNDQATAVEVVIQQRLHEEDLAGFMLKSGECVHLCLASEWEDTRANEWPCKCPSCKAGHTWAKPKPPDELDRPLARLDGEGDDAWAKRDNARLEKRKAWLRDAPVRPFWRDPRFGKPGALLFPAKFSREVLDTAKKPRVGMGPNAYAGQHQQRPIPKGGNLIRAEWLALRWHVPGSESGESEALIPGLERRPYNPRAKAPKRRVIVTDAAFKDEDTSDFVAIGVFDLVGPDVYLVDLIWDHLSFSATAQALVDLRKKWSGPASGGIVGAVYIEDRANGTGLLEVLRKKVPGLIPMEPLGSKYARISAAADFIQAGNLWLPSDHDQIGDLVIEATRFPKAAHDDAIDMLAYALLVLLGTSGATWLGQLVKS